MRAVHLITIALLLTPTVAKADEATELAKRYYKLGEELYHRAAYDEALENFKRSHKYSGKPELFYNMGRCHEALGNLEQAIEKYEAFQKARPDADPRLPARVKNLRERLAARKNQQAKKPPKKEPAPAPEPPSRGLGVKGLAGWISAGLGVALLGAGAAMGAVASSKASEVEDAFAAKKEWSEVSGAEDTGKSMETGAIIALATGGAALATGAVLLVLHYTGGSEERPAASAWIAPAVTPSGAALGAGFSF